MKDVNATIITIGDELLIGQTIDTNSAFIASELNGIGVWLKKRVAIGDLKNEILHSLQTESEDADIIILTGGLGPTADDITKPTLCEYFGSQLIVNPEVRQNIESIFAKIGRPLTESNLLQAQVPDNCTVLPNRRGTAPGMWFEKDDIIYISLPGVPHEMKGLMVSEVLPRIKEKFVLPAVMHRTLLTSGVGETVIAEAIHDFETALPAHVKLAYLPAFGQVRLRLTGRGKDSRVLEPELDSLFKKLKDQVRQWTVAEEDIPLAEAVYRLLKSQSLTLSTAESCTGGHIAHLLTERPGSSLIYKGSVVAYANEIKTGLLSVNPETLERFGAVSEETVREMAEGLRSAMDTDLVLATSGIMGPSGGSPEKPVGTVWMAVGDRDEIRASKHFFRFDRERNIDLAAHTALTLLYRFVLEKGAVPSH